jgi:subtilisin family serine protease
MHHKLSLVALCTAFSISVSVESYADAPISWALDRIDQVALPLDGRFSVPPENSGDGVTVYVVDGGVLSEHVDFGGRVTTGPDFSGDVPFRECERIPSHGTHTAGLVGSQTYGVAKKVSIVDVRVLDCQGNTSKQRMAQALHWIQANAVRPAVVSMSVGSANRDDAIDEPVRSLISSGIPLVLSAGNEDKDACHHYPTNIREAIVVGATSEHDVLAPFSNYGKCVDILAPGWQILSTMAKRANSSGPFYGTSQAAPLVAGAAALYLQNHPEARPAQVEDALKSSATADKIRLSSSLPWRTDTPNLLLNVSQLLNK